MDRMGYTRDGAPSGQVVGADRVNRNYAVYVNAMGQRYMAPEGKPRNPGDRMIASKLTQAEAVSQASARETLRQQANIPVRTLGPNADPARAGNLPTSPVGPNVDPARAGTPYPNSAPNSPGGGAGDIANNMSQSVGELVNQEQAARDSVNQNMEAVGQGPQPVSAGLEGTWLDGRNQNAIQFVMNGTQVADPRQALNMYLKSQGMDTHANRGFLEQAMANYNPLYQIMNPNTPIDPEYALLGAGNFASGLMGMSGGSMNRVDTRNIYDKIWADEFRNFNSEQVDQTSGGPSAAYQRIVDSISAIAPYMGQQNADYLLTRLNMAYEQFLDQASTGDGMKAEQDFMNYIMQFNPQEWY